MENSDFDDFYDYDEEDEETDVGIPDHLSDDIVEIEFTDEEADL